MVNVVQCNDTDDVNIFLVFALQLRSITGPLRPRSGELRWSSPRNQCPRPAGRGRTSEGPRHAHAGGGIVLLCRITNEVIGRKLASKRGGLTSYPSPPPFDRAVLELLAPPIPRTSTTQICTHNSSKDRHEFLRHRGCYYLRLELAPKGFERGNMAQRAREEVAKG